MAKDEVAAEILHVGLLSWGMRFRNYVRTAGSATALSAGCPDHQLQRLLGGSGSSHRRAALSSVLVNPVPPPYLAETWIETSSYAALATSHRHGHPHELSSARRNRAVRSIA